MHLAFTGAHGSGKTTLANLFVERCGYTLLASNAGPIAEAMDFDMNADNSIGDRIDYQFNVLDDWASRFAGYRAAGVKMICDRTPLDMAAYLLCDVTAATGSEFEQEQICAYVEECLQVTRQSFEGGAVISVPPGIPVKPRANKPLPNAAFQWHHHYIVTGMMHDLGGKVLGGHIPLENWDLELRFEETLGYLLARGSLSIAVGEAA